MVVSFKYWDDCVEVSDLKEMWKEVEVNNEWIDAGETKGQKVHLSRDPDGQPYLTQTEMRVNLKSTILFYFIFGCKLYLFYFSFLLYGDSFSGCGEYCSPEAFWKAG